ncbi:hypothetical protein BM477_07080 [Boudabousia marimammalium]|uniref:HAD family hydrolase n=1 Tax=Boudabousia marimammalium TaxID=156892 RepID=A0A1Q5PKM3_9ACTO|nr:hypothetical protein BM477_07080 [Boudabousia marimammalium]
MIAFDIDGTTLLSDGTVTERMKQTIKRLQAAGATVLLASGRASWAIKPVLAKMDITSGYVVCSNGAVLIRLDDSYPDGFEVIMERTFDPTDALLALREAMPDVLLGIEIADFGFEVSHAFPEGELTGNQRVVDFDQMLHRQVCRVIARDPDMDIVSFKNLVESAGLHSVEWAIGWTAWVDIAPENVSKASALEELRQRLNLPMEGTITFGDGWNDAQMLEWAHLSVAMGDSPQGVVDLATARTARVDEDGVPAFIEAILSR